MTLRPWWVTRQRRVRAILAIQNEKKRAFGPLPEGSGARGGDDHQCFDVQLALADALPGIAHRASRGSRQARSMCPAARWMSAPIQFSRSALVLSVYPPGTPLR